jgi:16S rRNA (guanine527-N7)-methyltransferase
MRGGRFHVKHGNPQTDNLYRLARQMGLLLQPEALALCIDHVRAVLDANERVNLTAIRDEAQAVRLHVLDSLAVLPEVADAPAGRLLDIGTGGGFPGLPLCVASARDGLLLDSVRKKADAVRAIVESLGLGDRIEVAAVRAEELEAGGFAVAVVRAVSELPSLVELAAPHLIEGGVLVALKGQVTDEELRRGDRAAEIVGLKRLSVRRYELPEGDEQRAAIAYRKVGEPRVRLPRRNGLAQKKPLA